MPPITIQIPFMFQQAMNELEALQEIFLSYMLLFACMLPILVSINFAALCTQEISEVTCGYIPQTEVKWNLFLSPYISVFFLKENKFSNVTQNLI